MKFIYLFVFLSVFSSQIFAGSQQDRQLFLSTYENIKQNNVVNFTESGQQLSNYILYPYLEYAYLDQNIDARADSELLIFIKRFPHSVLADDIHKEWIKRLAKRNNWERIVGYYTDGSNPTSSQCLYQEALIRTGQTQRGLQQGKKIWMTKKSLPDECSGLSQLLRQHNQLSNDDYWQRISLLMENNKTTLSSKIAMYLTPADAKLFKNWKAVHSDPAKYLPRYTEAGFTAVDTPHARKIITHGLKRLARKKHESAKNLWLQLKPLYRFTPQEIGEVESYIYARLARNLQTDVLPLLSRIPAQHRSQYASIWMARIALRTSNWRAVLDAISGMDQKTQQDDAWIYWKAKALDQLGQTEQAMNLFKRNAQNATYYGFLSADRLGQPYHVLNQPKPDRSAAIHKVRQLIGIRRALELFAVGKPKLASREWFKVVKILDKQEKLAAAELAHQEGQAFTAIVTVSKTKDWNVVDLRFPLLYRNLIMQNAAQQQIDPAWVYGVMRRESAFKVDALSRVKAFGLMQLMPKTASGVSRSLGLKGLGQRDFARPEINVKLGSRYLSQMLKRFRGSYAKATAAYNAGPGRIPRWSPVSGTIPADQWIESIQFDETRKYVRGVMAYTTIYDHKLRNGKVRKLSDRLRPISPEVR